MAPVAVRVTAVDAVDAFSVCSIAGVETNEPVNGTGDGDTAPDWLIGSASVVHLKAERSGRGQGRTYTVSVRCSDSSGKEEPGWAVRSADALDAASRAERLRACDVVWQKRRGRLIAKAGGCVGILRRAPAASHPDHPHDRHAHGRLQRRWPSTFSQRRVRPLRMSFDWQAGQAVTAGTSGDRPPLCVAERSRASVKARHRPPWLTLA